MQLQLICSNIANLKVPLKQIFYQFMYFFLKDIKLYLLIKIPLRHVSAGAKEKHDPCNVRQSKNDTEHIFTLYGCVLNPGMCNPLTIHATVKKKSPFVSQAFGNRHEAAIDEKSIHLCSSGLFCINHREHLFSLLGCCSSIGWNYYTLIESQQKGHYETSPWASSSDKRETPGWGGVGWSASMPLLPASMALQWVMYLLHCCALVGRY